MSLSWLVELEPGKNDQLVVKQTNEDSCLLFTHEIFATYRRIPFFFKLDAYFRSSQGIVLDYYKLSSNNYVRARQVKNRHRMVIKTILENVNLSADACYTRRFPLERSLRHIEFGVSSLTQQNEKAGIAELIHAREQFQIKFATVKKELFVGYFVSLVSPVGWSVLVASLLLGCVIGTLILLHDQVESKICQNRRKIQSQSVFDMLIFLLRAFLEQAGEPRREIRHIYAIWLSYCLLITATYRSNLTNSLSKPGSVQNIENFQDLVACNKTIAGVGRSGRPGQSSNVRAILAADHSISFEERETFKKLEKKYRKEKIEPAALDILIGKYNYLDDAALIEPAFGIMEKRYGINIFAVGRVSRVVEEFWAVGYHAPKFREILKTLRDLGQTGIFDHFKKQQELIERVLLQHSLQVILAKVFVKEELDQDEEDSFEDMAEKYERLRLRLAFFGSRDVAKAPRKLSLKNFVGILSLLGCGLTIAGGVYVSEIRFRRDVLLAGNR